MSALRATLAATGLLGATLLVQAAEAPSRPWRADADFGVSSVPRQGGRDSSNGDPVLGVALGLEVAPQWSVEVFHRTLSLLAGFLATEYTPQTHTGVSLRKDFPLSEGLQAQLHLGLGRTTSTTGFVDSADRHDTDPSLALGLAYRFSEGWSAQLTATRFTKSRVTTTLAGFEYRF